jgi:outer membrane receptor protein involved in Fe transport
LTGGNAAPDNEAGRSLGAALTLLIKSLALGIGLTPMLAQASTIEQESSSEILVTAQLRSQKPLDVPISLSVVTGAQLEKLGLDQFGDMARFVPGLEVQQQSPNNPGFVIRGITSDSGEAFTEPRISVFQDGVSISRSRGSYVELFDIARVEVAKGPQSTLYGRGALIGGINIVQNKADLSALYAQGGVRFGNFGQRSYEAVANVPASSAIAIRIAGRVRRHDGTVDNLLGGRDYNAGDMKAVRGSVRLVTDRASFDLIANYQSDHGAGTGFKSLLYRPTDPATGTVIGDLRPTSAAALIAGSGFEGGSPLGLRRHVWGVTGLGSIELGDQLTLTSISAYRRFGGTEVLDVDGTSLPIFTAAEDARGKQLSQELRLEVRHGPVTAMLGSSYFYERGRQRTPVQFDERMVLATLAGQLTGGLAGRSITDPAPAAAFNNILFTGSLVQALAAARGTAISLTQAQALAANLSPGHRETTSNFSRTQALDLYGDLTIRLSGKLELGLGGRYNRDWKKTGYSAAIINGRSILGGVLGALAQPAPLKNALLAGLAVPGAATIPLSAAFPLPGFGLAVQPTANNGMVDAADLDDQGVVGRVTLRYSPVRTVSVYGGYARGRRPKVLAASSPASPGGPAALDRLPAEVVDSFEVGAKAVDPGRHLSFDGAAFHYRYRNFQTLEQHGTQFVTSTAGNAESYGFEGALQWAPKPWFSLSATYAFNHSRFKTGAYKGNRLRLAPDHMASFYAVLSKAAGGGQIVLTPSLTYQSRAFFDDDNDRPELQRPPATLVPDVRQDEVQSGYVLANLELGWESTNKHWRVRGFIKNLFNRHYMIDAGNTGDVLGLPTAVAGEPRFFGIEASLIFGSR